MLPMPMTDLSMISHFPPPGLDDELLEQLLQNFYGVASAIQFLHDNLISEVNFPEYGKGNSVVGYSRGLLKAENVLVYSEPNSVKQIWRIEYFNQGDRHVIYKAWTYQARAKQAHSNNQRSFCLIIINYFQWLLGLDRRTDFSLVPPWDTVSRVVTAIRELNLPINHRHVLIKVFELMERFIPRSRDLSTRHYLQNEFEYILDNFRRNRKSRISNPFLTPSSNSDSGRYPTKDGSELAEHKAGFKDREFQDRYTPYESTMRFPDSDQHKANFKDRESPEFQERRSIHDKYPPYPDSDQHNAEFKDREIRKFSEREPTLSERPAIIHYFHESIRPASYAPVRSTQIGRAHV